MSAASSNPLGQILVQRGVLSVEELQEALRLKESQGGSLAINLVMVGAVDDHTLASFYMERYKAEPVDEAQLERATLEILSLLPDDIIYETGILPLWREPAEFEDEEDSLIVGMIDPSETQPLEEAAFFCPLRLVPRLLTIGQMARHYRRLTNKPWKITWEAVSERRRELEARHQSAAEPLRPFALQSASVTHLLEQAQALDASIDAVLADDDGEGPGGLTLQLVSVDGAEVLEEEIVELTQVKHKVGAGPEVSSVVIDTTVMSTAEAEARLDELVAASTSQRRARSASSRRDAASPQPQRARQSTEPGRAAGDLPAVERAEPVIELKPRRAEALRKTQEMQPVERSLEPVTQSLEAITQPLEPVTQSLEAVTKPMEVVVLDKPKAAASLEEMTDLAWFSDDFDPGGDSFDKLFSSVVEASVPSTEAPSPSEASAPPAPATEQTPSPTVPLMDAVVVEVEAKPREPAPAPPSPSSDGQNPGLAEPSAALEEEPPSLEEPDDASRPVSLTPHEAEHSTGATSSVAGLTFVLTDADRSGAVDNDLAIARRKLSECSERDEVGRILLRFLSKRYKRVMLLSLRDGELGCWQGWNGVAVVKRGAVSFPLSALPCFERVMSERSCYLGPIATRSELNSAATAAAVRGMARAWAGEAALSLVACPLALRERAVLLMVCDDGPGEPASMERQFLATVKHEAEKALERAILKRKRQVIRK